MTETTPKGASAPYYEGDGITLFCGDCTTVMPWVAADVLVTDPPYGVAWVQGDAGDGRRGRVSAVPIAGDTSPAARDAALALWGDRPALIFGSWRVPRPPGTRQRLLWWKRNTNPGLGTATPWSGADEEVYVLGDGWVGPREVNVLVTDEPRSSNGGLAAQVGHPTPKPVGLMERLLLHCPPGVIADPFAGSGSTLLAARSLGRRAVGVEIEERYCELIATRLSQGDLFGETA